MDLVQHLLHGLSVAVTPGNLVLCFIGVLCGTLVGVLPGLGPAATIALLMPVTFGLDPTGAIIMLAGIFYGAQYGGSTTAILVNLPGESSSIVTALDGHIMAKNGRAGDALAIAAIGSFFAGTVGVLILATLAVPMIQVALSFGSADYFSLMLVGLLGAIVISRGSFLKAIAMVSIGLCLSTIGTDIRTGTFRLTFGIPDLRDGLDIVPMAMGLFGISEIMRAVQDPQVRVAHSSIGRIWPSLATIKTAFPAIFRGTAIGSALGVLPGAGGVVASVASYAMERKVAKGPVPVGQGAIEGVAGPEAANNAGSQAAFIPMLTLGLPPNSSMALMIGALMVHGIAPGPLIMVNNADLFWGLVVSMWIGNVMLVVLNLPLVGIWVQFLRVPYHMMFPIIILMACLGVFAVYASTLDIVVFSIFAVFGYIAKKADLDPTPLLLGFILGPLLEENFIRSMQLSGGSFGIFIASPISVTLLAIAAMLIVLIALPMFRRQREAVLAEDE